MLETSHTMSQYSLLPAYARSPTFPIRQRLSQTSSCSTDSLLYHSTTSTPYESQAYHPSCLPRMENQRREDDNGLQVEFFHSEAEARLRNDELYRSMIPDASHPLVRTHTHDEKSHCSADSKTGIRNGTPDRRASVLKDCLGSIKRPKFGRSRSTSLPSSTVPPERVVTPDSTKSRAASLTSGWDDSDSDDEDEEDIDNIQRLHRRFSSRMSLVIGKLSPRSTRHV